VTDLFRVGLQEGVIIIEILQLVDQLEDLLSESWRLPFTSTLMVDEEECLRIIDQLRVSVPEELSQARRVLQEKEHILAQAEREAERIIARARERAAAIEEGRENLQPPEERSEAIIAEAERQARELTEGANRYARQVLEGLQEQLEDLLAQVRAGIVHLSSGAATASPSQEGDQA